MNDIFWPAMATLAVIVAAVGLLVGRAARQSRTGPLVVHQPDGGNLYNPDGVHCTGCGQNWPCDVEVARHMAGPLPAVGEVDETDYVTLALQHQPCFLHPCAHWNHQLRPDGKTPKHCRCGRLWPCVKAGLLNTQIPGQRDNRNGRDAGRWS